MRERRDLTTTSYALLSLLAVQPFTTYELTQQMERSLADFWPRSPSVLYEEAKNLVAHGLAAADQVYTGRRASTLYRISDAGRRALAAWLDEPGAGPTLHFEALVQVAFADNGTLEQLRRTLRSIREASAARRDVTRGRGDEYLETGGPFPDRLPVIGLVAKLLIEQAAVTERWARWAEEVVAEWPAMRASGGAEVPDDAFRSSWAFESSEQRDERA